ncbi:MAG: hypothetical protein EYC70_14855 [Planctomycetota bacterium]|nr:MAG: hypothetical protein EYC70_14855 [Planctomycetota bacterium]
MILALLLLLLGLGFITAEVFFPSFGVLSVLAGAAVIGAVVLAFQESTTTGLLFLLAAVMGLPAAWLAASRMFPHTPLGRRMVAQGADWSKEERAAVEQRVQRFVGQRGRSQSPLRPAGIAQFDGERVDVITRGEHVEAGTPVRALQFEGNRLVVEACHESEEKSA